MDCSLPSSSVQALAWNSLGKNSGLGFPGKNTGVGCHCHFLLQGIFSTQGSNPVSHTVGRFFTVWATGKSYVIWPQKTSWEYVGNISPPMFLQQLVYVWYYFFFLLKQISQKKTFGLELEFCFWKLQFCIQFFKIHTKLFRFSVCVCVCVWLIVLFKNVSISSKSLMYCYKIFNNELLSYLIFVWSLNVLNISISFFMLITWWEYFLSLMLLAGMCAC